MTHDHSAAKAAAMFCSKRTPGRDGAAAAAAAAAAAYEEDYRSVARTPWENAMPSNSGGVESIGRAERDVDEGVEIEDKRAAAGGGLSLMDFKGIIAPANTRTIGNLITVELKKGKIGGFGFSITTRDNLDGPDSPIFIKHILPGGAAIKDGRLRPGDRLLEVDNKPMTGRGSSEAAAILRSMEIDRSIQLVVSRQTFAEQDRKDSEQKVSAPSCSGRLLGQPDDFDDASDHRCSAEIDIRPHSVPPSSAVKSHPKARASDNDELEMLTVIVDFSKLTATQLGLKVKRLRKEAETGLLIRSVIEGGIAARDGQLRVNDCILEVNGISMFGVEQSAVTDRSANVADESAITAAISTVFDKAITMHGTSTIIDIFRSALQKSYDSCRDLHLTIIRRKFLEREAVLELPNLPYKACDTVELDERGPCTTKNVGEEAKCTSLWPPVFTADELTAQVVDAHHGRSRTAFLSAGLASENGKSPPSEFPQTSESSRIRDDEPQAFCEHALFLRDGFGRRSLSEKRGDRIFLSRLEIYRIVKENRRKRQPITPCGAVGGSNLRSSKGTSPEVKWPESEGVEAVSQSAGLSIIDVQRMRLLSMRPPSPSSLPSLPPSNSSPTGTAAIAAAAATTAPLNVSVTANGDEDRIRLTTCSSSFSSWPIAGTAVSKSSQSSTKIGSKIIRRFLKKGFPELFRPEWQTSTSQGGTDNSQSDSDIIRRGSVQNLSTNNNSKTDCPSLRTNQPPLATDVVASSSNFPSLPGRNLHHDINISPSIPRFPWQYQDKSRFHLLPGASGTFPQNCYRLGQHFNSVFLGRYFFPVLRPASPPMTYYALRPSCPAINQSLRHHFEQQCHGTETTESSSSRDSVQSSRVTRTCPH